MPLSTLLPLIQYAAIILPTLYAGIYLPNFPLLPFLNSN